MKFGFKTAATLFVAGVVLGGVLADQFCSALPSVRKLSVFYNCGGFEHDNGEFRWEKSEHKTQSVAVPMTQEEMAQDEGIKRLVAQQKAEDEKRKKAKKAPVGPAGIEIR